MNTGIGTPQPPTLLPVARLGWLDTMKGISILWIILFHYFIAYNNDRYISPLSSDYFSTFFAHCAPSTIMDTISCSIQSVFFWVLQLGFHAVGVFLVLSGFGLSYSLTKTGGPTGSWWTWYKKRLLRLFPMYWTAHLLILLSSHFVAEEPIDYRFVLSFLGDRIYPLNMIFYYLNAAWWYFGLLLELYLVFPILFRLLQKVGPGWFLTVCGLVTLGSRYLLLVVHPVSGSYVLGAFFGCRLWEFAFGMAFAAFYRQNPALVTQRLFTLPSLIAGVIIYSLGMCAYGPPLTYTLTDPLIGTGLFLILAHVARWCNILPIAGVTLSYVGTYSFGLYLLHQPYAIYVAERMRPFGAPTAMGIACIFTVVLVLLATPLEKSVKKLTSHLLDRKKETRTSTSAPLPTI